MYVYVLFLDILIKEYSAMYARSEIYVKKKTKKKEKQKKRNKTLKRSQIMPIDKQYNSEHKRF